ncbi:hypothetical protein [Winogradskyella sp. 3972H.M.0a.05]|uniref:hypothetical protein n=1 Tax=Winogradskyella sp. 3972H.M.0a.05 TaxID=2950277 RepID=UPI003391E0A7
MKTLKSLLVIVCGLTMMNVNSQDFTQKQLEIQKNKVEILTMEEQWDIQIWFFQEVEKMNLSEEESTQYSSTLLMYTSRMKRLDDLDKDYTYEEILVEMESLFNKMNSRVSTFLSDESYEQHLETMETLHTYILKKMQREDYLEKVSTQVQSSK